MSDAARQVWLRAISDATRTQMLSAAEFRLAYELIRHNVGYDVISVSQDMLAKRLGLSARSTRRSLKILRESGFLRQRRNGSYICNTYLLCLNDKPISECEAA